MASAEVVFRDRYGLHPRAAMRLQQTAAQFHSRVTIQPAGASGRPADASSMISLVSLGVRAGDRITVAAEGDDADSALAAMRELVEAGVCHR